jgi:hypothetical protein
MYAVKFLILAGSFLLLASPGIAAKKKAKAATAPAANAAAAPSAADTKSGMREKHIVREAKGKKGDKGKIDFEGVDIAGQRRSPYGSVVTNEQPDKNYDFVKLRLNWHDEMTHSAKMVESGRK